ncbi:MAG: putative Eukaryotic translation initiation factor 5 [Streblomastix strix]|uniref:Putative Eukaryotic translation initiation factor 5 n=1 Tax=Streblomastix strix TaxID=222440 RepID=A0A5J4WCI0_9EUKA|nr:MAG: putative Eukaryotic translation initiation factor 5 [Streblomastix strix]
MENIGGDQNDASYRYKMPRIQTSIIGKGNGIQTAFYNIFEVAIALNRKPQHLLRYFGMELGALQSYNEQTHMGRVNGKHSFDEVHEKLINFINEFVLCQRCKNPETTMDVEKNDLIFTCLACGAKFAGKKSTRLINSIIKEVQQENKEIAKRKGRQQKAKIIGDNEEDDVKTIGEKEKEKEIKPIENQILQKENEKQEQEEQIIEKVDVEKKHKKKKIKILEQDDKNEVKQEIKDQNKSKDDQDVSLSTIKLLIHVSQLNQKIAQEVLSEQIALDKLGEKIYSDNKKNNEEQQEDNDKNDIEEQELKTKMKKLMRLKDHPSIELFDSQFGKEINPDNFEQEKEGSDIVDGIRRKIEKQSNQEPIALTVENIDKCKSKLSVRRGEMGQFGLLVALERKVLFQDKRIRNEALKSGQQVNEDQLLLPQLHKLINALYQNELVDEDIIITWYNNISISIRYGISAIDATESRSQVKGLIEWLNAPEEEEEEEEEIEVKVGENEIEKAKKQEEQAELDDLIDNL